MWSSKARRKKALTCGSLWSLEEPRQPRQEEELKCDLEAACTPLGTAIGTLAAALSTDIFVIGQDST